MPNPPTNAELAELVPWTGAPEQLSSWMTQFCRANYPDKPQHVFWEIEAFLRKQLPPEPQA